jgi:hypothetical protein
MMLAPSPIHCTNFAKVSFFPSSQGGAEFADSAEFIVTDDPAMSQSGQAAVEQVEANSPLFLEHDLVGNVALLPSLRIRGPVLREIELAIERSVTGRGGVGQKHADLAVVDLAQSAAPLPPHAAGLGPLLGESAAVDHHDALGFGELLADMRAQFCHHGFIIPLARSDEKLERFARHTRLDGDRFARLAVQPAEQALNDQGRVVSLFDAIETGQIALQKAGQTIGATLNSLGSEGGVVQKSLSLGMIQEGHCLPPFLARCLLTSVS